jgi:hypothetical protein
MGHGVHQSLIKYAAMKSILMPITHKLPRYSSFEGGIDQLHQPIADYE